MEHPSWNADDVRLTADIAGQATSLHVRDDEWRYVLDSAKCRRFTFKVADSGFTARAEPKKRGLYWYAYRRTGGQLRKVYLGRLADLTVERLIAAADKLASTEAAKLTEAPTRSRQDGVQTELPAWRDRLIGRERELAQVRELLFRDDIGLVTLTGAGGSGKTRLAAAIAATCGDQFADGVCFVALAPLSDPALVASAIGHALGVQESVSHSLLGLLEEYLRGKQLLLLLDNFEQLLPAAPLVSTLLSTCLKLKVLVTSRALLHLVGEHVVTVPPLSLPGHLPLALDQVLQYDAVRLFCARARATRPDFALTDDNAEAVAEICRRLDGLPLAIELAAARVRLLAPQALLARLERRLPLLTDGPRDAPARQRTLRDTIAWSYDLLIPVEQCLFRRLAVFAGGCTLAAMEGIELQGSLPQEAGHRPPAAQDSGIDTLDLFASLIDKSLLTQVAAAGDGEPRFTMLETIREYAWERLELCGEVTRLRQAHAEQYLALAERAQPHLIGSSQVAWLRALETEHDNFRAALIWSLETPEGAQVAVRLVGALYRFWQRRGHLSEGREWLARVLTKSVPVCGETRARVLNAAGVLARTQGDILAARSFFEETLLTYRELGDGWELANALHNLASVILYEGDYERATALVEESLAMWRELDDPWSLAQALRIRGLVALAQGASSAATTMAGESLSHFRQVGDLWGMALQLGESGVLACTQGDLGRATLLFRQGLEMHQALNNRAGRAWTLANLGRVACAREDFEQAGVHYRESLDLYRELGHRDGPIGCMEGLAAVEASQGLPGRSAHLIGAAQNLREAIGQPVPGPGRASHEGTTNAVRALLGEESFAEAWAEGRAMTLEQAIAYALVTPSPISDSAEALPADGASVDAPSRSGLGTLTRRQAEVATLVASGLTNAEIAERLVLSELTVDVHLRNIFTRLDVRSRAQVAVWAAEQGLLTPSSD